MRCHGDRLDLFAKGWIRLRGIRLDSRDPREGARRGGVGGGTTLRLAGG